MNDDATLFDPVIDVLATWGANVRPGGEELFRLLDEFSAVSTRDEPDTLGRVLEASGDWLDPALRDELSRIRASARAGAPGPDLASRTRRALGRVSDALASRIAERRAALEAGLVSTALAMERAERDEALDLLWASDASGDVEAKLAALRSLDRLERRMRQAGDQRSGEVRQLLATGGDVAGEELRRSAAAAIESGDLTRLDAVRRDLASHRAGAGQEQLERQIEDVRRRLSSLCEDCRQLESGAAAVLDARTAELLTTAIGTAERSLAADASASSAAHLEGLQLAERTLAAVRDGLSGPIDAARSRRESVARSVLRLATGQEEPAGSVGAELPQAALRGGLTFHTGLEQLLGELRAGTTDTAHDEQLKPLGQAVDGATRQLDESARLLATERVLASRRLLDRATGLLAERRVEGAQDLRAELEQDSREIRHLAERAGKLRRDRGAAVRQRLKDRAERVAPVAERAEADELTALVEDLAGADGRGLEDLGRRLEELARPIENRVRLDAARCLAAANGKERALDLEKALDDDDLPRMAELSEQLRPASAARGFFAGTRGRILLGLGGVVLLAGAVAVWRWSAGGPEEYVLRLDAATQPPEAVSLTLVRDGRIFDQREYDASSGAAFELPPGEYEVFVNERYTGRVVRVPEDPREVQGIPYPPGR